MCFPVGFQGHCFVILRILMIFIVTGRFFFLMVLIFKIWFKIIGRS